MKGARLALTALLAGVFLFTPSRPLQIAAFVFACVPLLDLAYLAVVARSVRIRRRDSVLRAHRGDGLEIELILENRSRLPVYGAVLFDRLGAVAADGSNRLLLSLAGRERRVVSYRIAPRERGEYCLGPASLRVYDFFGFAERLIVSADLCRLIVFPRVDRLAYSVRRGSPMGSMPSASSIDQDPTRYRSLREYLPGDGLKRVNWKASARTGILCSNEYENALDSPLVLLLNLRLDDFPLKKRHELAERSIECAASFALAASRAKQALGFVSTGNPRGEQGPVSIAAEPGSALAVLDLLARIEPNRLGWDEPFSLAIARLPYRSHAYFIGGDPGESAQALDAAVKARGGLLRLYIPELSDADTLGYRARRIDAAALEDLSPTDAAHA